MRSIFDHELQPAANRLVRLAFSPIGIGYVGLAFGAVVFSVSVILALSVAIAGFSVVLEQGENGL